MTRWLQAAKQATDAGTELTKPTEPQARPVLSVKSVLSERGTLDLAPPARADEPDAATFRHGQAPNGWPVTWTGRIVSLAAWRDLTAWERDGPDGRHWNGFTRQWEPPGGGTE